jgi:hypothetical protein
MSHSQIRYMMRIPLNSQNMEETSFKNQLDIMKNTNDLEHNKLKSQLNKIIAIA